MATHTQKLRNAPPVGRTAELAAGLREAGLRVTPQRLAVCRALAASRSHPTAQALYDQLRPGFPGLSRATIYNTLQALVDAGLIDELGTAGDGAQHYDANLSPHVNLVCTNCHRVEDFAGAPLALVAQTVADESGYRLRGARVVYYGLCPRCQKDIKRNS
jgi:Fur family transcriptional regulator, peroxide stress response regulator